MANSISYNSATDSYVVDFAGNTIQTKVTDKASVIDDWMHGIIPGATTNIVGLDIEWRPHRVSWMSNKTATLQLCMGTKCLIIQLFYLDYIPQSLKDFLSNPNYTFVGVEVGDDAKKLRDEYGLVCSKTEDVRAAAMLRWPSRFRRPGLKDLAWELVGLRMNKMKSVTCSDWQARVLSEKQIEYGCIDSYASYRLGVCLC